MEEFIWGVTTIPGKIFCYTDNLQTAESGPMLALSFFQSGL